MTRQIHLVFVVSLLVCHALCLASVDASSERAAAATASFAIASHPPQAPTGKDVCLQCHGPYKDLAERTAKYKAPSGETVTPHRLIPHKGKEPGDPPECKNCHQAHPVPPAGDLEALPKPKVEWCYTKCHHTKDFTPCQACHKG
jgi:hypothetical protein